jgi:hypothetical protein
MNYYRDRRLAKDAIRAWDEKKEGWVMLKRRLEAGYNMSPSLCERLFKEVQEETEEIGKAIKSMEKKKEARK